MHGKVIKYTHHGNEVYVKEELKGTHREHCLCFECAEFEPGTPDNCHIAATLFRLCQEFGVTTPVFECPEYLKGKPDLSKMGR